MEVGVFSRRGADPAAAFPHHLTEKHDVSDTEFLTDAGGYLTALARFDLYGELNYSEQNFHREVVQDRDDANRPLSLALAGGGSPASARRWLRRFKNHYNYDRPDQALDGRTPVGEVLN